MIGMGINAMSNGKPTIPDLNILEAFEEPFVDADGIPRDERLAERFKVSIKQVYAIWNKHRFTPWIEYGVSLRSGWLTDAGKAELNRLRNLEACITTKQEAQP